jgi:hypothetical protein
VVQFHKTRSTLNGCRVVKFKKKYRVIHKSLRDFRPLRYSNRDGHAEGQHVNRGKDTPSLSYLTGARYVHPWWRGRCQISQFWQIPRHKTLSYSLSTPCLVTTAPSGETCKYATAPSTKKNGEILCLLISFFLLCLSWMLRSRVLNFRKDLWITLYIDGFIIHPCTKFHIYFLSCFLTYKVQKHYNYGCT